MEKQNSQEWVNVLWKEEFQWKPTYASYVLAAVAKWFSKAQNGKKNQHSKANCISGLFQIGHISILQQIWKYT